MEWDRKQPDEFYYDLHWIIMRLVCRKRGNVYMEHVVH